MKEIFHLLRLHKKITKPPLARKTEKIPIPPVTLEKCFILVRNKKSQYCIGNYKYNTFLKIARFDPKCLKSFYGFR